MTPAALVERVRALGITLAPAGDRLRVSPKDRLPADLRAELIARKAEVLAMLAAPPDPAEVDRRATVFRAQLARWLEAGHATAPLLRLPEAAVAPVTAGTCIGCGLALPPGRTWRCAACLAAVDLALASLDSEPAG